MPGLSDEMFESTLNMVMEHCQEDLDSCMEIVSKGNPIHTVNAVIALACACFIKGSLTMMKIQEEGNAGNR